MPYCQAFGCTNHTGRTRISVFTFPNPKKKPDLFKQWARVVAVEKFLSPAYVWKPSDVLCVDHFSPDSFEEDKIAKALGYTPSRKKLRENAVPNVFSHRKPRPVTNPRAASVRRMQAEESQQYLKKVMQPQGEMQGGQSSTSHVPSSSQRKAHLTGQGVQTESFVNMSFEVSSSSTASETDNVRKVQVPKRRKKGFQKKRLMIQLVSSETQTEVETSSSSAQTDIETCEIACQFPAETISPTRFDHPYAKLPTRPANIDPRGRVVSGGFHEGMGRDDAKCSDEGSHGLAPPIIVIKYRHITSGYRLDALTT